MNLEDLSLNGELLASIIRSFEKYNENEPLVILENIKKGSKFLILYPIEAVEGLLKYIMVAITQMVKQIYSENIVIIQSGKSEDLHNIKENFQVALDLLDISNHILDHILQYETVSFIHISSVPVNMAQGLLLTFEHCKNSQKTCHSSLKSMTEVVDLFRKAQEIHTKFLRFLDTRLTFNFLNENEIIAFRDLLDVILKISEALSGINIKSMADNWKGFITLIQKYSNILPSKSFNISAAITSLTAEIDKNLQTIYELGVGDLKKSTQILKVNGFLIKVVMKLFETEPNIFENCDDVLNFCFMIYSWHPGIFQTQKFPTELVDAICGMLHINTESFMNQIFCEGLFVKTLCFLNESHVLLVNQSFGFIHFSNEFLKNLPKMLKDEPEILEDVEIVPLLCLIFRCTRNCYKQYFRDYDSILYEELVINISVAVLLLPNNYLQVENILLNNVTQENIWTVMMAMDIWCMVLRFSPVSTSRSSINILIKKIQDLNLGVYIQTPAIIHLKVLTQRILKQLPTNAKNEEVARYNPTHNLFAWKILNLRNIPLSQRFHIEFILGDFFDKMDNMEKDDCSVNEIVLLLENLHIISSVKFESLEINTSALVSCINHLWSFNVNELNLSNVFFKYFMYRLTNLTASLLRYLTGEHVLLVLTQMKQLLSEDIFQLLICDIIQKLSKRGFDNFQEKFALLSLIIDILKVLLTTKNPIVLQRSLEMFIDISKNETYEVVVNKTLNILPVVKKLVTQFQYTDTVEMKYNAQYMDKLDTWKFRHQCLEWTDSDLPQPKKLKVDENSDLDEVINSLKTNTQRLSKEGSRNQLNSKQVNDIKGVIQKLEMLLI